MTEQEDASYIPPWSLEAICIEAEEAMYKIWRNPDNLGLTYTYCTRCYGSPMEKVKQRCVCYIETCECVCARCWYNEKVETLKKAWLEKHKPKVTVKLDVADFASIK